MKNQGTPSSQEAPPQDERNDLDQNKNVPGDNLETETESENQFVKDNEFISQNQEMLKETTFSRIDSLVS